MGWGDDDTEFVVVADVVVVVCVARGPVAAGRSVVVVVVVVVVVEVEVVVVRVCKSTITENIQDPNAGDSHVAILRAEAEVSICQRRFRALPIIGAARRWLSFTSKVLLPIGVPYVG